MHLQPLPDQSSFSTPNNSKLQNRHWHFCEVNNFSKDSLNSFFGTGQMAIAALLPSVAVAIDFAQATFGKGVLKNSHEPRRFLSVRRHSKKKKKR